MSKSGQYDDDLKATWECLIQQYIYYNTIQRRLAWPPSKDDMQINEAFHVFNYIPCFYVKMNPKLKRTILHLSKLKN